MWICGPVTAKWHRAHEDGRLNSRDGADEFRGDLAEVRTKLRDFAQQMHRMAYKTEGADATTPPVMSDSDLDKCFEPLAFGFSLVSKSRMTKLPPLTVARQRRSESRS